MGWMKAAGALTLLGAVAASPGQPVDQAFECALPYRAAVEAAAKLKVTKQKAFSFPGLPNSTTIEFAPGSTHVFGQTPTTLALEIVEPEASDPKRIVRATLKATFPKDAAIDQAVRSTIQWHLVPCVAGMHFCVRHENPNGMLGYYQEPDQLRLQCEYRMREEDLGS